MFIALLGILSPGFSQTDTTPPTVSSFTPGTATGNTVNFTLTFSEAVTGLDAADITSTASAGATATIGAITGTGATYTIPVTFSGTGTLTLTVAGGATANIKDAAGNLFAGGAGATSTVFTLPTGSTDTTAPTVNVTIGSSTATSVTFNVAFSETVTGGASAAFTATGAGGATGVTIASVTPPATTPTTTYTVVVNYTGTAGTVTLAMSPAANTAIKDASNNFFAGVATTGGATSRTHTITATDTTAPSIASFVLDTGSATPTSARMVVTFSEAVTGVDQADFEIKTTSPATATITGVSAGTAANSYNIAFNYSGTAGSVQMAIKTAATGITDSAGNAFVGRGEAATAAYPINGAGPTDSTLPTVSSFTTPAGTIASPVNLTLVFSESVTGVSADDFVVSTGATIGTITGSGTTWTVPVTFTGTSPVTVTVIGGATANIRDAATHWFAGGSTASSVTFTPGTSGGGTAPAITSPLTASVAAGASFTYTIAASNSPTSFTATNLPAGLTFTSPTISGTVATAGTYNITIGATNASGSDSKTLVLTVTAAGSAAPAITSPLTASVAAGASFTYTIAASNSPTSFTATNLPAGLTFTSPTISGTVATAGTYNITIGATNASGSDSKTLVLTVTAAASGGDKGSGPATVIKRGDGLVAGQPFTLPATTATGQPITWILVSGNATMNGNVITPKNKGAVVVRAIVGGTGSQSTKLGDFEIEDEDSAKSAKSKGKSAHRDRLSNLSSRLRVSSTDANRTAIAGFVVTGNSPKQVLVRAIGPGLSAFGVRDALSAARLQLHNQSGSVIAQNDGWNGDAAITAVAERVGAFQLASGSRDSALLVTLPPGAYTAQVGATGTGTALIEVYDATSAAELSTEQLINISTRGFVDSDDGNLIAGFVVTGDAPKRVLVRGIGAALSAFGVSGALADPVLELYTSGGAKVIARNDNWDTPQQVTAGAATTTAAEVMAAAQATGAFALPAGSKDAAILITLMPGSYSAVVSGANRTTGAGLVEVYEVPNP